MKQLMIIVFLSLFCFANSPWKKQNLYDSTSMTYFIPFELWLQIPWDGNKQKKFPQLNSTHDIQGHFNWYHPYLKKHLKVYKKKASQSSALFTFYPNGIAKVYEQEGNIFFNNGVHFPAGYGWKMDKIYEYSQELWIKDKHYFRTVAIRITNLQFDEHNTLQSLSFDFFINGTLKNNFHITPIKN